MLNVPSRIFCFVCVCVCVRVFQAYIPSPDRLSRGKMSIAINLKKKEGASVIKRLCNNADVLIEPFRVGELSHSISFSVLQFSTECSFQF